MPRPKSLLPNVIVDEAKISHNCQHNARHRINKGDKRLKVKETRAPDHYCVPCALEIIRRDIEKLKSLAQELES
jgi:hypothetical protein